MKGDLIDSMRWILLFGKYVGIMPLGGLGPSEDNSILKCKSGWVLLYSFYLCVQTFLLLMRIYSFIRAGFPVVMINSLVFFGIYFTLSLLVLRFCLRWNDFIRNIQTLENLLPPFWKPRSTVKSIKLFIAVMLFLGIAEELTFPVFSYYMTLQCYKIPGDSGLYMKSYYTTLFAWYLEFQFSYVAATVYHIVILQASFQWIYLNILVMVLCVYLKNRFEEFNRLIVNKESLFSKRFKPTWCQLQVHYTRISKLVSLVDASVNAMIFFIYMCNLYDICLQMFFILNKLSGTLIESNDCAVLHANDVMVIALKTCNLLFVIMRTALICYLAAEVHTASRASLKVLHTIPSSAYNNDMRRLMTQVYYSKLGLTGLKFFRITRGIIFTMVTKLLTYELVLLQFERSG